MKDGRSRRCTALVSRNVGTRPRRWICCTAGRDSDKRAWLIAVAHPRIPRFRDRLTREEARGVLTKTVGLALTYAGRGGVHPLDNVDRDNPPRLAPLGGCERGDRRTLGLEGKRGSAFTMTAPSRLPRRWAGIA